MRGCTMLFRCQIKVRALPSCLFTKRLEQAVFLWPPDVDPGETLALSSEQLSMLIDGIDWRHEPTFGLALRLFGSRLHGGRLPGTPAFSKSDVRRIQPARSPHNADFAGLSDVREIALAEIQICPDDGGRVAVGRIEQID